jgi:ribosome-associated protein
MAKTTSEKKAKKTVAVKKSPVKKATSKKAPAKKAAAKKVAAKKAPAKKVAVKKVAAKTVAARTAPARTAPAKTAPAKTAPVKKAAAKKAPAKKSPLKKGAIAKVKPEKPLPPARPARPKDAGSALAELVVRGMQERKAKNITVLDMRGIQNRVSDFFVVCDAESTTHVNSIADSVEDTVKKETGEKPFHTEGWENSQWILMDYVNVVAHVFQKETREFYNIEGMWADADVEEIKN